MELKETVAMMGSEDYKEEEAQKTADDLKKKGFGGFVNTI